MAKWGTKNPPQKKGRYLVTIETSFGRQVLELIIHLEEHY